MGKEGGICKVKVTDVKVTDVRVIDPVEVKMSESG